MQINIKVVWILVILLLATLNDLYNYKVSNKIIICGWLLGLVTNLHIDGVRGIQGWLVGGIIPLAALFILYIFRMIGASDIKLFSVVGCFFGVRFVLYSILFAFFLGAIISLFQLIKHKILFYRLQYLVNYISYTVETKQITPYYTKEQGDLHIIPFSLAISGGVILCILKFVEHI